MNAFGRLFLLTAALGVAGLLAMPSPAADKLTPEQINKLIEQMGSGDFDEREKATAQLEAQGDSIVDVLRKAAKSEDAEIRKRAEDLVAKIEKRTESVKLLAPKRVHLVYKDTPVAEAVQDFAKKSGFRLGLHDPENKLKDRKITLDTSEVTFWEAFDQFCKKAGLVEANPNELLQQQLVPPPVPLPVIRPGIRIQPAPNPQPLPPAQPDQPAPPAPPKRQGQAPQPGQVQAQPAQVQPAKAQPAKAQPAIQVQEVQIEAVAPAILPAQPAQPAPAVPVQVVPIGVGVAPGAPVRFPLQQLAAHQITLVDGKPQTIPTDASGAIRVRISDHVKQLGKAPESEIRLGLELTAEPKMQITGVVAVRIDKAVDDQGQKLTQIMMNQAAPNPANPFGGIAVPAIGFGGAGFGNFGFAGFGLSHYAAFGLKKEEKAAKTLKEVTGVATAQVLAPAQPVITADGILKAAGKTFKGEGGTLKIVEVTRAQNGQVTVVYELQTAPNAAPPGGAGGIILPVPVQRIKLQPAPKAVPQGVLPPAQPIKLPQQLQAQQPMAPVQVQAGKIQIQIQAQPGVMIQIGGFGNIMPQAPASGISLVDDKGNTVPAINFTQRIQRNANVVAIQQVMVFQLDKGQEPAKLLYSTQKSATIDIPFTLKDITIP